jgi:outer membrane protein assembly factor BamB
MFQAPHRSLRRYSYALLFALAAVNVITAAGNAAPTISSLDTTTATRSGRLIINGTGFGATREGSTVIIGGHSAHVTRWMDTQVVAYVPDETALGPTTVRLATPAGDSNAVSITVTTRPASSGRVKWRFVADSDYFNHRPSVGGDGTIYAADLANLYALTPEGGLKWIYRAPGGAGYAPPALGLDGTIYLGTSLLTGGNWAGGIVAVFPDGTEKWRFGQPAGSTGGLLAGPNVGPDGNIYAVSEIEGLGFFALSPSGKLLFATGRFGERGNHGQEIVFGSNQAYFGVDTSLYGYSLNGTRRFQVPAAFPQTQHQPAVGPNGNVYVHTFPIGVGLSLGSYTAAGSSAWNFYEFPGNVQTHPDVGPENTIYMGRNLSTLLALQPAGTVQWRYVDTDRILDHGPIVEPLNRFLLIPGRDGNGKPGFVLSVDTDGTPRWRQYLPDENGALDYGQVVASTRARFTADGDTAYVGTNILGIDGFNAHSYLYALDTSSEGTPINAPPQVTLTGPTAGSTFTAPASIVVAATASDSDGTVTKVEFYSGSTLIGADTSAPYAVTWANVPAGTYSFLSARRR